MGVTRLAESTFEELAALPRDRCVLVLPVGATEAHGPHLPLATDVLIAEGMAEAGAARLAARGLEVVLLPPIAYSVALYAREFPGTLSLQPETAERLFGDLCRSLSRHGFKTLALANAHLEPAHIQTLATAARRAGEELGLAVVFPDVTRKPWALRLGDEFKSGACHAGRYEGSLVLALRDDLVRKEIARTLAPNWNSLAQAIREGRTSFGEAGGPRAYFGDPGSARAEEGRATLAALGAILDEAVALALGLAAAP